MCTSAEKNLLALKWTQLGPKRGQNEVVSYFHAQNALVFTNFECYHRKLRVVVLGGDQSAEKKFR